MYIFNAPIYTYSLYYIFINFNTQINEAKQKAFW